MKLRLPKKLTTALIAGCIVFALNTTAAAATTGTATFTGGTTNYDRGDQLLDLYLTKDLTTGTATSTTLSLDESVNIRSGDFYAGDYTMSMWVTKDSLSSNQLLFAYAGSAPTSDDYGANGIYWNATNSTIIIGRGKASPTYDSFTWKDNAVTGNLSSYLGDEPVVNLTFSVDGNDQRSGGQIVTLYVNGQNAGTVSYAGNMNNNTSTMKLFVSTVPTYGNITVTNEKLMDQSAIYALMGLSNDMPAEAFNYVWTGSTDGNWNTTTANWETTAAPGVPSTFESNANSKVLLGTGAACQDVTITSGTNANIAKLTAADNYTLTIAEGGSLSTGSIVVDGEDKTLSLKNVTGHTYDLPTIYGTGSVALTEGSFTLSTAHTAAKLLVDGSTLNLRSGIAIDDLTVAHGTVTTQHNSGNGIVINTLDIGVDGTFMVIGGNDAFGYNTGATKEIVMKGAKDHLATLALEQTSSRSVTMTTNIAMHGYSAITSKEGGKGFNTYGGNIAVDGVENSIEVLGLRRATTITVNKDAGLSIAQVTLEQDGEKTITKAGEGTLNLTYTAAVNGLTINEGSVVSSGTTTLYALSIAKNGTLTVTSGTTSVSGNSNVVSNTIGIGATGVLNLTGMYDVSDIASDGGVEYVGGVGIQDGNGFKKINGFVHVLEIAEGGRFSQAGATFNYGGMTYQLNASGAIDASVEPNYAALYVNNTGDVSYAAAQKIAGEHEANVTTVILNTTGATITMDAEASVALSMASTAESATVLATEDITLSNIAGPDAGKSLIFSADGHTITVQGDNAFTGNVVVDNGTLVAGSANALGSGAINVSGGNLDLGGHSISNSVNTAGESTIGNGALQGDLTVDNASLTIDQDLTLAENLIIQNENRIEVADGATLYLTHTITNENYIELAGKIDISAISGTATGSCYYVGGETKGNGFLQTEYEITLVDCGMSGDLDWSEAEIYHSGNKVTKEDWGYVTYAVTDASKFYIFSGTESVSKVRSLDANTNIQMSSGTTLKVDEDISLSQIQAIEAAAISIDSGKVLSGYTLSMNLTLEGTGVYALDSRTSLGSLTLGNDWAGTVRLSGSAANAGFNSMARTGSWLELNGFSGYQNTPTGTTTANIILTDKDDGTAAFTATYGINSDYDGYTMKFTGAIKGEGTFVANARNNYVENYEFAGDISGWTGEFRYASGRNTKLTISGNAHDVNAAIDGDGRLTLCVNTSATFNEAVDVHDLTLNNGNATFNDALQVNGSIATSGTCALAMGEGQSLALGAAITNSGDLTLSGTFDVSGRESVLIGSDYSGGVTPGNGFGVSTYGVQVVQNSGSTTLDWSAAEIVYDTPGYEKRADGYIVQGVNDGLFHVKNGTESVSTAQNAAEEAGITMQGVELNNGTTLIVDKEFSTAQVSLVSGSAVLNVKAGVTLLSDGADHTGLSLSGNGMYKLAAGSSSPNIDWSGNVWHGTVMLTDDAKQDWNLNDFGHAGSKVGLDGVSGNFARPNVCGEIVPTLVLVGDGLTVTACYTNSTYTFSGGVEGDGNWTYGLTGNPHNQTYIFTGDVSNWTGAYESVVNKTSTLQFQGDATKMGAAITQTAGAIKVVVGNGTNEHTTKFANTVEASSLTVQENAKAVLGGDTTITDSLTLYGKLETEGGSLSLGADATMQIGSAMSMKAIQGEEVNLSDNAVVESNRMYGSNGAAVLNNVSMDIIEDYAIENMSISGSVIDISEGKHLYVKHVNIEADARITDEAAWLDMVDTHGWLDNSNTEAAAPVMSLGDTLFYRSGDDAWMRLDHDVSYVALTSELFSNVTMTGSDLWLDLTGLADTIGSARAFSIAFKDALYDVNGLRVVATVDGEHYFDGYYTTKQDGTTTTLYFSSQIPEPTTSTLSLLALAALAARRRRK